MKRTIIDKLSLDYLREQILKSRRKSGRMTEFDPRVMLLWYCFFGVAPWFFANRLLLVSMLVYCIALSIYAKTSPLFLAIFTIGVITQTGLFLIVSLFFGGSFDLLEPLLLLALKLTTVSLASMTVFTGLHAERLALGLLWFGLPQRLAFSVSFGYRMLPVLLDEFSTLTRSFISRGCPPEHSSIRGKIKYVVYRLKITIMVFYPLLLNMAKRSRTTAESLALRGYLFALNNPDVRRKKLASLSAQRRDFVFVAISILWLVFTFLALIYLAPR